MAITDALVFEYDFRISGADGWTNHLDLTSMGGAFAGGGQTTLDGAGARWQHADNALLDFGATAFSLRVRFSTPDPSGTQLLIGKDKQYAAVIQSGVIGWYMYTTFGGLHDWIGGNIGSILADTVYDFLFIWDGVSLVVRDLSSCHADTALFDLRVPFETTANPFTIGGRVTLFDNSVFADYFNGTIYTAAGWSRDASSDCAALYAGGPGFELPYSCDGMEGAGYSDPHTLTGTLILGATTDMDALWTRVHRLAADKDCEAELWYWRESAWHLSPAQPLLESRAHPIIDRQYRQPATAQFDLPDNDGALNANNRLSPYNYLSDAVTFDPLIDEARKVLLRGGIWCWDNLTCGIVPTSSLPPSAGILDMLSDGGLGDMGSNIARFVKFSPTDTTPLTVTFDLGAPNIIRNAVVRFATKSGSFTLPASVVFEISDDGGTWTEWPAKPVGGTDGDWDESETGQVVEFVRADMGRRGRYLRVSITPTGAQDIGIDELVWYGSDHGRYLGANIFVGYLGDDIEMQPEGYVRVRATDVLKKLQDNNEVRLTKQYGGSGNVELADILYDLLTSSGYWHGGIGEYDQPFSPSEIGWSSGTHYTGFVLPAYQSQANNLLGYGYELLHMIGWQFYADNNGVLQLREPPYRPVLPEAVFVAAPDGNGELRHCRRLRTGKEMRNVVEVATGNPTSNSANTVRYEFGSVKRYGRRRVIITDPLLTDQTLREKACDYILRDYAWRLEALSAQLSHTFEFDVKRIYGFRTARRPFLHSKTKAGNYDQNLWAVESVQEHVTRGDWWADCQFIPYVPAGAPPPINVKATPNPSDSTQITLTWDDPAAVDGVTIALYNIYASTSEFDFTGTIPGRGDAGLIYSTAPGLGNSVTLGGWTPGTRYFFFMTSTSTAGAEGRPSSIVSCEAGGSAGDDSNWTITDLAADLDPTAVDGDGTSHYDLHLTFTSPPVGATADEQAFFGFKHGEFRYAIGAIPANPTVPQSWLFQDEWHGNRVPSEYDWYGNTPAQLDWHLRFATDSAIASGTTIYVRVFTWQTTNGFGGQPHPSNIASVVIP